MLCILREQGVVSQLEPLTLRAYSNSWQGKKVAPQQWKYGSVGDSQVDPRSLLFVVCRAKAGPTNSNNWIGVQ